MNTMRWPSAEMASDGPQQLLVTEKLESPCTYSCSSGGTPAAGRGRSHPQSAAANSTTTSAQAPAATDFHRVSAAATARPPAAVEKFGSPSASAKARAVGKR